MPYRDPQAAVECKRRYFQVCATAWKVLKESQACFDCGGRFRHWQMEFDHVRGVKKKNVAHLAGQLPTTKTAQEEIDKCDLVCVMCHANRTYYRRVLEEGL